MKDGYKYENGLVKVVDYNENNVRTFETRDYRDNINEILMTENEIEHLQSKKNYYCEQKSRIEKKLEDLTFKIFRCGMWFAGVFLFCSMWCPLLFQNNLIFSFIVLGGISASGFGLLSSNLSSTPCKIDSTPWSFLFNLLSLVILEAEHKPKPLALIPPNTMNEKIKLF